MLVTASCSSSGQVGDLLDDLGEGALDVAGQRLELGRRLDHVGQRLDPRDQVGLLGDVLGDPHPLGRLNEDPDRAVGHLEHPGDDPDHADVVELVGAGLVELGVAGGDQDERALAAEHVVDQLDRALLADRQRGQRVGIGDHVLQRQHRQRRRQRLAGALRGSPPRGRRSRRPGSRRRLPPRHSASEPRGSIGTRRVTLPGQRQLDPQDPVVVARAWRARRRRRRRARPPGGTGRPRSRPAGRRGPRSRRPAARR